MGNYYTDPDGRMKPATPAPSQPAGAREWLPKQPIINYLLEMYNGRFAKDIVAAMEGYARQQTAAKDAALEAAERERDSLREANARLAADLDAALKAGKESHGA